MSLSCRSSSYQEASALRAESVCGGDHRRRFDADGSFMRAYVTAFLACIAAISLPSARACSIGTLPYEIDSAERAVDQSPPDQPVAEVAEVKRGHGPVLDVSGFMKSTSCDDIGLIRVEILRARDDRTPLEKMGYRVVVVRGDTPDGLERYSSERAAERGWRDGRDFFLHWIDGAREEQEPFEFWVTVTAIDLAGTESPPSELIRVQDSGRVLSEGSR